MAQLVKDPNLIALSLHVDYWDYIGWKDTFANPQFTKRQKAYARAAGSRTIYTPQMIIAGTDDVVGNDPMQVLDSIRRHMMADPKVKLSIQRQGAKLTIRAEADPPLEREARVQVVRYLPQAMVEIQRGENAGKTVSYHNVVTSWQPVAEWSGQQAFEMVADVPGEDPVVVIIQSEGPSEILAAARSQ